MALEQSDSSDLVADAEKSIDRFISKRAKAREEANAEEDRYRAKERRRLKYERELNREGHLEVTRIQKRAAKAAYARAEEREARLLAEDHRGLDQDPGPEAA